jgi:hypothetical protein
MSLKIEIKLTPAQVEEALRYYLSSQGFDVKEVRFDINSGGMGDRGGYDSPSLRQIVVQVNPKDTNRSFNSLAAQIAAVESDPRQYGDH